MVFQRLRLERDKILKQTERKNSLHPGELTCIESHIPSQMCNEW